MQPDLELAWDDAATLLLKVSPRVSFARRPIPLVGDLRLSWRLPLLLLTLHISCRRGTSSHKRLHLLNWAVRSKGAQRTLLLAMSGARRAQDVLVRADPSLSQVIDYALAERLVDFPRGDRVHLTPQGRALAVAVLEEDGALQEEKAFLLELGKTLSEEFVDSLTSVGAVT